MSEPEREKPAGSGKFVLRVTATKEEDGGFVAKASKFDIFSQGNTWDELCKNVRESVSAYFFDCSEPTEIFLQLIENKMMVRGKRGGASFETEGPFRIRIATKPTVLR